MRGKLRGPIPKPLCPLSGWDSVTYPLRKAWIGMSAKGHSQMISDPQPQHEGHDFMLVAPVQSSENLSNIALLPVMLLDFCSFFKDYLGSDFGVPLSRESCRFWTSGPKCQTGFEVSTAIQPVLFLKLPQIEMSPPPTNLQMPPEFLCEK